MKISTNNLLRSAGTCAVIAGICYVLVGLFHPPNLAASVTSTRWQVVHVLACAFSAFGLFGMTGLYARQAKKSGWLGLAGYVLFSSWLVLIMGFSFVEAFVLPRVASTSHAFVQSWMAMFTGPKGTLDMGALPAIWTSTAPLYIGGGLLFGIATYRAGVLPRWGGVLFAAGTLLAPIASQLPNASQPKVAIPVGIALAWLGYALASERRAKALPTARQQRSSAVV